MSSPKLLWVDLRTLGAESHLYLKLHKRYLVYRVTRETEIAETIKKFSPRLLFFEYDSPDLPRLKVLRECKIRFPSLPIIMLTEYHSEALAVWAFRAGVRDYFVEPILSEELSKRIDLFLKSSEPRIKGGGRNNFISSQPIPIEFRFRIPLSFMKTFLPAINYIEANYFQKIRLETVARLCGLGRFQFSKAFRKGHGITFREFVVRYRIGKALELIRSQSSSLTDIALNVGFNDYSHFAKAYKKYIGGCPSEYRSSLLSKIDFKG